MLWYVSFVLSVLGLICPIRMDINRFYIFRTCMEIMRGIIFKKHPTNSDARNYCAKIMTVCTRPKLINATKDKVEKCKLAFQLNISGERATISGDPFSTQKFGSIAMNKHYVRNVLEQMIPRFEMTDDDIQKAYEQHGSMTILEDKKKL